MPRKPHKSPYTRGFGVVIMFRPSCMFPYDDLLPLPGAGWIPMMSGAAGGSGEAALPASSHERLRTEAAEPTAEPRWVSHFLCLVVWNINVMFHILIIIIYWIFLIHPNWRTYISFSEGVQATNHPVLVSLFFWNMGIRSTRRGHDMLQSGNMSEFRIQIDEFPRDLNLCFLFLCFS